ncbi:hypothetical protein EJ04DRAFT_586548 [Polyplosphaeria fusca]|uniref:Uncharacterized protein n=1 Tax=Polyplosphaeria fusca TaxID=682080 RepID=A0A9P4QSU4_9PLEO|nr:hypothetical protein EJ04DRAFT_586548 [Polyplosphaeria fusca]
MAQGVECVCGESVFSTSCWLQRIESHIYDEEPWDSSWLQHVKSSFQHVESPLTVRDTSHWALQGEVEEGGFGRPPQSLFLIHRHRQNGTYERYESSRTGKARQALVHSVKDPTGDKSYAVNLLWSTFTKTFPTGSSDNTLLTFTKDAPVQLILSSGHSGLLAACGDEIMGSRLIDMHNQKLIVGLRYLAVCEQRGEKNYWGTRILLHNGIYFKFAHLYGSDRGGNASCNTNILWDFLEKSGELRQFQASDTLVLKDKLSNVPGSGPLSGLPPPRDFF